LFAKHQNVLRGRWENFWATEQTSVVELVGAADVLDKMVYTLTNPVKDHLVETPHEWPGASSLDLQLSGRALHVYRPRRFFRPDGSMPEEITLELAPAPGLEELTRAEFAKLLMERLGTVVAVAAAERARGRFGLVGRRGVLRQNWWGRPSTKEPRRKLSPRVACKNVWRRIEAIRRNRAFV